MAVLPLKPSLAIATFITLLMVPDFVPSVKDYKVLDWSMTPSVLDFTPRDNSAKPIEDEQARLRPDSDLTSLKMERIQAADDEMKHFYQALHRTEMRRTGAVTRILHYGDSPTTADLITADVRTLFQSDFGDAGHGFVLLAKPWAWYGHRGVEMNASGWRIDPANQAEVRDGLYGLGAVSFRGGPGAVAEFRLRDATYDQVEVAFLQQANGGQFRVSADEEDLGAVDTAGDETRPAYVPFSLPPGARRIEVHATGGPVRLFGIQLRKNQPGVIYDSLGVNGAYVSVLARLMREDHWRAQLQHYNPDLVIINYGTNESVYPQFVDSAFDKELRIVIRRIRHAAPEASILLMSPMDRGQRNEAGEIDTVPVLARLIAVEQRVAAETGCAFFNTFEAMGGLGTMGRWYKAEPRLVGADFIHPMPAGARIVGNLLYRAVREGYNRYKLKLLRQQSQSAQMKQKS